MGLGDFSLIFGSLLTDLLLTVFIYFRGGAGWACMLWNMCGDRWNWTSFFASTIMWVLGVKRRSPGMHGKLLHTLSVFSPTLSQGWLFFNIYIGLYFYLVCMGVFLHVYLCTTCKPDVLRGWKSVLDSPGTGAPDSVSCHHVGAGDQVRDLRGSSWLMSTASHRQMTFKRPLFMEKMTFSGSNFQELVNLYFFLYVPKNN